MKLDNRRTVLIGLAFLGICCFWQMYDSIVPLILTGTFHFDETVSGAIMAADNVLALFLLPFFGALSDRTHTRIGKRMPYILFGTVCAAVLMNLLPIFDNSYAAAPGTLTMIGFVAVLGALLVAMGIYRSPAVALMPDLTPKPFRSRANAIINLMGALGGILYLAAAALLFPDSKTAGLAHVDYRILFITVSAVMLISIAVLFAAVKEPKLAEEQRALEAQHPEWNLAEDDGSGKEKLPRAVRRSLGFLLASIALWFFAYNAVTTWFTTYISAVMGEGLGGASTCLLIATGGAVVSYIPVGFLAGRIGRKRCILGGVALLTVCFAAAFAMTVGQNRITPPMYIVFALVGLAWAAINVNSLPMVVEMCRGSDVGRFTGLYYTFSMAAQVVTPILSGSLLGHVSYSLLFPYAAFFAACSFVTMCFVRHGDARAAVRHGLEAFEDMDC